jgi:hypothetical protein
MPHVIYAVAFFGCPWPGCGCRIEMIDFRLGLPGDPALYNRAVTPWQLDPDDGLVARCPGCGQFVWFGKNRKQTISDPPPPGYDVLPDDWHTVAFIASPTSLGH